MKITRIEKEVKMRDTRKRIKETIRFYKSAENRMDLTPAQRVVSRVMRRFMEERLDEDVEDWRWVRAYLERRLEATREGDGRVWLVMMKHEIEDLLMMYKNINK